MKELQGKQVALGKSALTLGNNTMLWGTILCSREQYPDPGKKANSPGNNYFFEISFIHFTVQEYLLESSRSLHSSTSPVSSDMLTVFGTSRDRERASSKAEGLWSAWVETFEQRVAAEGVKVVLEARQGR
ncbi:hypothetical protein DL93DRAFT_2103259 [Clavulina sp. PMI_390]|nr:hypothetical protein DL93DRAFT_2103259 [Clavulina sp. PMI_390]